MHLTRGRPGREDLSSRQPLQVVDELHEVDDGKHRPLVDDRRLFCDIIDLAQLVHYLQRFAIWSMIAVCLRHENSENLIVNVIF